VWVKWVLDVATKSREPIESPDDISIRGVSADGKHLLTWKQTDTGRVVNEMPVLKNEVFLVDPVTLRPQQIAGEADHLLPRRLFLHGTRLLTESYYPPTSPLDEIVVFDYKTKDRVKITSPPQTVISGYHFCPSPDGRRIAYVWTEQTVGIWDGKTPRRSGVVVCGADGQGAKTIYRTDEPVSSLDWR
jgi:hypothetical protein